MNSLQYQPHEEQQRSTNTEFLDEILLAIGLVGELIHSSSQEKFFCFILNSIYLIAGVMCWISTQSDKAPIKMEVLIYFFKLLFNTNQRSFDNYMKSEMGKGRKLKFRPTSDPNMIYNFIFS